MNRLVPLLACASLVLSGCARTQPSPVASGCPADINACSTIELADRGDVAVKTETKTESTTLYKATYSYPTFLGQGTDALNAAIRDAIDGRFMQFKKDTAGLEDSGIQLPLLFDVKGDVLANLGDLVSVKLEVSTYTGGAHGNVEPVVINYDARAGKVLALGDLFEGDYLAAIGSMAADDVKRQGVNEDQSWFAAGTAPTADNYQSVAFLPTGIRVYFPPYQVAAYAAGIVTVDIPYDKLRASVSRDASAKYFTGR